MSDIDEILTHLKLTPTVVQRNQLLQYVGMVIAGNARVNITGAGTTGEFIRGPLFDGLTLMPVLGCHRTMVDIGSGGGLPGIPLAILFPDIALTLTEPRTRRVQFLRHVATTLGLNLDIRATQDRELPGSAWDGAVAQAVFPPAMWLKRGRRLVAAGGFVYVLSSSKIGEENLPGSCRIDQQRFWARPVDGAPRFAARIAVNYPT